MTTVLKNETLSGTYKIALLEKRGFVHTIEKDRILRVIVQKFNRKTMYPQSI